MRAQQTTYNINPWYGAWDELLKTEVISVKRDNKQFMLKKRNKEK